MNRRWFVAFALMLFPSAWFAWQYRDMPQLGLHHDDAIYFVSARALALGGGYRIQSLPGEPAQTKYPPLYPALLSLVWLVNPEMPANLPWAALLAWLPLPVFLWLARRMFLDFGFSGSWAIFLCAAIALNPMTLILSVSLMTELWFCVLLLAALSWRSGLAGAAAYLVRSAGAPMAFVFAWRRAWRALAIMMIAIIGWAAWSRLHQSHATDLVTLYYANYLGFHLRYVHAADLPALLWTNFDAYLKGVGQLLLFNTSEDFVSQQVARLTCIAAAMGVIRMARKGRGQDYAAYSAGLSAMLLLWHYAPSARFVYPMFPLLLAGWVWELRHVWKMIGATWANPAVGGRIAAGVVGLILATYCGLFVWFTFDGATRLVPGILRQRRDLAARDAAAYGWIRQNTPADARILAYDDPVLYLYTGRKSVSMPIPPNLLFHGDDAGIRRHVESAPKFVEHYKLDYLVVTDTDYYRDLHEEGNKLLQSVVAAQPNYERVYGANGVTIYRVER